MLFFIHIWWIPMYMKLRGSLMYLVVTRTTDTTCSKEMCLFSLWQLVFRLVPHSFSPNQVHSTQGRSSLPARRSIFWGSLCLKEFLLCSWGLSSSICDYYVFGCMLYFELTSLSQGCFVLSLVISKVKILYLLFLCLNVFLLVILLYIILRIIFELYCYL